MKITPPSFSMVLEEGGGIFKELEWCHRSTVWDYGVARRCESRRLWSTSSQVTDSGVMIRFHPFHRRPILFEFADIQKAEACSYRAFRDYGGWGIRYGKNGQAYNVSGHLGVSLRFVNGTHLMIGSQNHETLAVIINKHITWSQSPNQQPLAHRGHKFTVIEDEDSPVSHCLLVFDTKP